MPLISTIVVARNSERYLTEAIDSILAQTYPDFEIILVDGQSTDNTANIAKSYSQIRYVYQHNLGLSQARNIGLEAARGEYIAFLDSDDRWMPDKLELQADILINSPQIEYVSAHLQMVANNDTNLRQGYDNDVLQKPKWARTPGILMARKTLFERIGGFATEYKIAGDLEWFVRVQKLEIPTTILADVLLHKRIRERSLSTQSELNRREVMRVLHRSLKQKKG